MQNETIKVNVTETGQTIEVLVFQKRVDQIEVVVGEGVHSVKCQLTPVVAGNAYAGNVMGREIVYERSRDQVEQDLLQAQPSTRRR